VGDRRTAPHGKAFRPTLLLLSASAMRGRPSDLAHVGAAVELAHNSSLVHDDVMDGDGTRHHRPTVWHAFGTDRAILAGDAMLALATHLTAENAGPRGAVAAGWLGRLRGAAARRPVRRPRVRAARRCDVVGVPGHGGGTRPPRCWNVRVPSARFSPGPTMTGSTACGRLVERSAWPSRWSTTCSASGAARR
jgi:hypothetical protein